MRSLLGNVFGNTKCVRDDAFVESGMSTVELIRLNELLRANECHVALEIGMANGTSSVVICDALKKNGGGTLTSIDPYQTGPIYNSQGIRNVCKANMQHLHRLLEEPDYLALPRLIKEGCSFDFIFLDGWHSFDYTMVDFFFADLLLKEGGIVAFHDSSSPPVYEAICFLESHKPYERLCPPVSVEIRSIFGRTWRRIRTFFKGPATLADARARRNDWRSLAAYRKLRYCQTPQYPHEPLYATRGTPVSHRS